MPTDAPLPTDHPALAAWQKYQQTDEYANTRKWALHSEHVDGSLWAAFWRGYQACSDESSRNDQ